MTRAAIGARDAIWTRGAIRTQRAIRTRIAILALLLLGSGCRDDPAGPGPPPSAEWGEPGPPRVLVVNTLSETLSTLDPETGEMSVQAALLGTWANRVTVSPDGDRYLVTASGDNTVEVLSATTLERIHGIDVGPGSNPWVAVPIARDDAIVSDWLSGDVRRLDLSSGTAGPALRTVPGPQGIVVDGDRAWVACTNYRGAEDSFGEGRVDVVDLARWEVVRSVPVGTNPQDVLVAPDGAVHVLCTGPFGTGGQGSVHVLDPATYATVRVIPLGGEPGRFAAGGEETVWVAGFAGGVRRYSSRTLEVLEDPVDANLALPGFSAVDTDPVTGTVYVASFDADLLIAVEPVAGSIVDAWLVGDGPVDVRVTRP